jgi:ADP-ribosylation factor related protein 1
MFSLIVGFWRLLFRKTEFHVLILGVDGAGKTSMLEQIKHVFSGLDPLPPAKIPPTVGLNIGRLRVDRAHLLFWDLGGARALRTLWEKYYNEAHGLCFVVDAADHERLDEARDVLQQLLSTAELAGIPLLVFANKLDAPGALRAEEVQERFGLHPARGGSSQPQNVMSASALSGEGVEGGVRWLVEALKASPRALALQQSNPNL